MLLIMGMVDICLDNQVVRLIVWICVDCNDLGSNARLIVDSQLE